MIRPNKTGHGFTIVELTLAIAFLSFLLMAVLTLTIATGRIYVKGVTTKTINQAGRSLQDSLRRDFARSSANSVGSVITSGETGRICLGGVSYLWNTAKGLNDVGASKITHSAKPVKLARVVDPNKSACTTFGGNYVANITTYFGGDKYSELLGGDGQSLALHKFNITPISQQGGESRGLFKVEYVIGTNEPRTIEASGNSFRCMVNSASNFDANFNFCSLAHFDMIVGTHGEER